MLHFRNLALAAAFTTIFSAAWAAEPQWSYLPEDNNDHFVATVPAADSAETTWAYLPEYYNDESLEADSDDFAATVPAAETTWAYLPEYYNDEPLEDDNRIAQKNILPNS